MANRESVLVIGGSGFIGRVLVRQLRERGCDVRVLSRRPRQGGGVTWLVGEVADKDSIRRAADGCSAVFDLSMAFGATWADYERDFIGGARNVGEVCLELGVRRHIYTSTIAGLHLSAKGTIDESAGADPKPELRSWYARGKIYAERALLELHRERGLPVVIFRPGIVVGEGNKLAHPGIGNWTSGTACAVVGGGTTPLPMVLVEDVAQALVLAMDAPNVEGRTFNLAGDVRPSAKEYLEWASERSLRNFTLVAQPAWRIQAFRTAVWLGKFMLRRKDNEWQSWHELKNAPQRTWLDCSAAKELLGWRPVADRETFIARAIDLHLPPIPPGDLRLSASRRAA